MGAMIPHYCKTPDELAYLLLSRGMGSSSGIPQDELQREMSRQLSLVNYYRLAAYWHQFRQPMERAQPGKRSKNFIPGTSWERVMEYYRFDNQLRLLLFDAISRIEITLRGMVTQALSAGAPSSINPQNVMSNYQPRFRTVKGGKSGKSFCRIMLDKVDAAYHASNGVAARHYLCEKRIAEARFLPVWVFMEFATFGNLSTLLSVGLKKSDVVTIARKLGFSSREFFVSAVALLHRVRNECAHQGRVWNRHWLQFSLHGAATPVLKTPDRPDWKYQVPEQDEWQLAEDEPACILRSPVCTAAALTVCSVMLRAIAPGCGWRERVFSLFAGCGIPTIHQEVGFVYADWQTDPLWREDVVY